MAGRKRVGVYPHGRAGWRIQVKDPQTRRWKQIVATRERFQTLGIALRDGTSVSKNDAARLREKYESLLQHAAAAGSPSTEVLLGNAIKDYLKFQRNAPSFLLQKTMVLGEFRDVVGDTAIREITKQDLRTFEDYLRGNLASRPREGAKLHATSVARYLRYTSSFFNYCVREGWIVRSPFVNFQLPQDESTPIKVYSLKELAELVKWLRNTEGRDYVIWMIAGCIGLGLRSMELQGLEWENYDPNERFVTIAKTKNEESKRPQPVPKCLVALFERHRKSSGPMFPTQSGHACSRNQMNVLGRRIAKQRPGFAWNRLRRTYATLLQAGGVDSLIIDRLLGHSSKSSSIRVSARHYIGKEYAFYRSLVDGALEPLKVVFRE